MRKIKVVCQSGTCPVCGGEVDYDGSVKGYAADGCMLPWRCSCGATGYEGREESFDGMHYYVRDPDGETVEIEDPDNTPSEAPSSSEKTVFVVVSVFSDPETEWTKFEGVYGTHEEAYAKMQEVKQKSEYFQAADVITEEEDKCFSFDMALVRKLGTSHDPVFDQTWHEINIKPHKVHFAD